MQRPYSPCFEKPAKNIALGLPSWSRYSIALLNQCSYKTFEGAELACQRLHSYPFHIELLEGRADSYFRIRYEVPEKQHFLLLMLEGEASLSTKEGFYIASVKRRHLGFISNDQGKYVITLSAGSTLFLCIAFEPAWLLFFAEDQPLLSGFIARETPWGYGTLPCCRMDRNISKWIKNLYNGTGRGRGYLDGRLRYFISLILERYNQMAQTGLQNLAWQVKDYLDQNLSDPNITYGHLSSLFDESERAIRYHFQKEFKISLHRYLTHKRLHIAHQLILNEGQLITDVYMQAGYHDESTFRRAYHNFFPPQGKSDV